MHAYVSVYKVTGLSAAKAGTRCDPLVVWQVPGKPNSKKKTVTKFNTLNPEWSDESDEELDDWEVGDDIKFSVMDNHFEKGENDFLGAVTLSYDDMELEGEGCEHCLELQDSGPETTHLYVKVKFEKGIRPDLMETIRPDLMENPD